MEAFMKQLHDACGVVAIYSPEAKFNIQENLVYALSALQHRGQESAGIAFYTVDGEILRHVGMGKVQEVFSHHLELPDACHCGIGHVRYATMGASCLENAGPLVVSTYGRHDECIAIAHNGNLVNTMELRENFRAFELSTTTDSEIIALKFLRSQGVNWSERIKAVLPQLYGAYSLVMLADGVMHALRDPWGMRPLSIGRLRNNWIVASESCVFDQIGATLVRSVEPGEMITIDERGIHSEMLMQIPRHALCIFEYIYFADSTSHLDGLSVYDVREALGRELAHEHTIVADVVIPVPDSSISAALAYAQAVGIPYCEAIIKKPGSGRSFIEAEQQQRSQTVRKKFKFVRSKIQGKRLIVIDDSIVRGTTIRHLISTLYQLGACEVHVLSTAPPLRHPCYFGIDIPARDDLIAAQRSVQEVAELIGASSLRYLSLSGLARALSYAKSAISDNNFLDTFHTHFCYGCMEQRGWPSPVPIECTTNSIDQERRVRV